MIASYSITKNQKPTPEQIAEIREAAKRPIVFDEDCPEMTDEQLRQFKRVHPRPAENASVQTVSSVDLFLSKAP
ncbi:MAG: hypothetical protein IJP78_02320 [Clostridia bacterium]|nr:hypothetical protein [Clostridia bacterium]